jgi:hypothetical protein
VRRGRAGRGRKAFSTTFREEEWTIMEGERVEEEGR